MAQDIPAGKPADKTQQVFFVDDDLIERLLRGDPAPVPPKPQRPAFSNSLAPAIELASTGKLNDAVQKLEGALNQPENARGEPFGEARLEQVVRHNQCRRSSELSDQLLSEIRHWQPAPVTQQDDITLIIIDVVEPCPVVRNPKG